MEEVPRSGWSKFVFYARNSGPGWIQAAVTLGGGTLVSALYLGVIGGYNYMWLQPLAMFCGVVMLAALGYVTLSQDNPADRPFRLVEKCISPSLAWAWLLATVIANVVFCASQFALATDAIQGNFGAEDLNPYLITGVLAIISMFLIKLFSAEGRISNIIQTVIKLMVMLVVMAFLGVTIVLIANGAVDWSLLLKGFVPDFTMLFEPSETFRPFIESSSDNSSFWNKYIIDNQRNIIIGAFGTAVGINMTFLLPYTLFKKKWGKPQREMARYDLVFGLFFPFIISASCLIISTASQFHGQKDSIVNKQAYNEVLDVKLASDIEGYHALAHPQKEQYRSMASQEDKDLSILLAKRNANDLATALQPFLGHWSQVIFGIGILAMAMSTMLVHMMINGYAIKEAVGYPEGSKWFLIGAALPAISGCLSPFIWSGSIKAAIVVPASVIATTLLPIAYLSFILLINSRKVLGDELPVNRIGINILMGIALLVAFFASGWALIGKLSSVNNYEHYFGVVGIGGLIILCIMAIRGFIINERVK